MYYANNFTFIASVIVTTYYANNFTFVIKLLSANEDVSIVFLLVKANGSPAWKEQYGDAPAWKEQYGDAPAWKEQYGDAPAWKEQYGDASVIRRNTVTN